MAAVETIKVQVLHGDPLVAAGLTAVLRDKANVDLVFPSAGQCVCAVHTERHAPHVIVADYEQGLAVVGSRLHAVGLRRDAQPKVLIVTQRATEYEIRHALGSGVRGYLLLDCGVAEFIDAVTGLHRGMRHIDARAAQRLAESIASEALTSREEAVLDLVVTGCSNKVIAKRLDIAVGTVKSHLKAIFQKLDAGSRTEVAAVAKRRGLLTALDIDRGDRRQALGRLNPAAPGSRSGTAHT